MKRRMHGLASLEAALLMPMLLLALAVVLQCGRLAWCYLAMDKGTAAAARYLATVPLEALQDGTRRTVTLAFAESLLRDALTAAGIRDDDLTVQLFCGSAPCASMISTSVPATVTVSANLMFASLDMASIMLGAVGTMPLSATTRYSRGN